MIPLLASVFWLFASPPPQHFVVVELGQGDPFGSQAEGTRSGGSLVMLGVTEKRELVTQAGSLKVRRNGVVTETPSGVTLRIAVKTLADGKLRLSGTAETARAGETAANAPATEVVHFHRLVFRDERVRVRFTKVGGRETWADFTVCEMVPAPTDEKPGLRVFGPTVPPGR